MFIYLVIVTRKDVTNLRYKRSKKNSSQKKINLWALTSSVLDTHAAITEAYRCHKIMTYMSSSHEILFRERRVFLRNSGKMSFLISLLIMTSLSLYIYYHYAKKRELFM